MKLFHVVKQPGQVKNEECDVTNDQFITCAQSIGCPLNTMLTQIEYLAFLVYPWLHFDYYRVWLLIGTVLSAQANLSYCLSNRKSDAMQFYPLSGFSVLTGTVLVMRKPQMPLIKC